MNEAYRPAPPIRRGQEDTFWYAVSETCVGCGACIDHCPVNAIALTEGRASIDPDYCIDCGTCALVCPTGAAHPVPLLRGSLPMTSIEPDRCVFAPGCALSAYKPELPTRMLALLRLRYPHIGLFTTCCRHAPELPRGTTVINNCAGCDRRFRSLYDGIDTISFWEVIDSMDGLPLPDYHGRVVSVHDSCGYRHKPQVHEAVRSLLHKMGIEVREAEHSGTDSVCCGDNFFGHVFDEETERRIQLRADMFPCDEVVVYCIGCVRALQSAGKRPLYLPELLFALDTPPMPDTLQEYHTTLRSYIEAH